MIEVLSISGLSVYEIHKYDWKPDIDVYVTLGESVRYVSQPSGGSDGPYIEINFGNGNQKAYLNSDRMSARQLVFTYTVGSSGLSDRTGSTVRVVANSFSLNGHKLLNSAGQELSARDVPIAQTELQNDHMAENKVRVLDWTFWLEGGSTSSIVLNMAEDVTWTGATTWDFYNTGRPRIRAGRTTYYFEPGRSSGNRVVFTSPDGLGWSSDIHMTASYVGNGFKANGFPISFHDWSASYDRYGSNVNEEYVANGAAFITRTTISEVTHHGSKAIRVDLEYDRAVELSDILQEACRSADYDIVVDLTFGAPSFASKQAVFEAAESTATRKSFFYTIEDKVAGRMYLGNKIKFRKGSGNIFYTSRPEISRTGFAKYASLEIDRWDPRLNSVSLIDSDNTTYGRGDVLRVAVVFSEVIQFGQGAGDEMTIDLQVGSRRVQAKAVQPYDNNAILFEYQVEEGLRATDGISVVQDSFRATASSTIVDSAGNQADPLALEAALPAKTFARVRVESVELFHFEASRTDSYSGALSPFILPADTTIESTYFLYVSGSSNRLASGFSIVRNEIQFAGTGSDIQQAHDNGEQLSILLCWRDSANRWHYETRTLTLEPVSAPTWSAAQSSYTVARNRLLQTNARLADLGPITEADGKTLSFSVFEGTSQTESAHFRIDESGFLSLIKPYANTMRNRVVNGGGVPGTVVSYTQSLLNDGPIDLRIEPREARHSSTFNIALNLDGQLTRNAFAYREGKDQIIYPSYIIDEDGVLYAQEILGQNLISMYRIGHTGIIGTIDMVADFDENDEFTGMYWVLTKNDLYHADIHTGAVLKEIPLDHFRAVRIDESDEGDLRLIDSNGREYEPQGVSGFQTDPDPNRPVFYFDRDHGVPGEVSREHFGAFMPNPAQYGKIENVAFKYKISNNSLVDAKGFSLIDGGIMFSGIRSRLESARIMGEELQVTVTYRAPGAADSDPLSTDVETFQLRHEEAASIAPLPQALVKAKSGLVSSINNLSVYKQQLAAVGSKLAFVGRGYDPDRADDVTIRIFEGNTQTESAYFGVDSAGYLTVLKAYHPGALMSVALTIEVSDKKAGKANAEAKITDRQTLHLILPSATTALSGAHDGKSLSTNGYSPLDLFPQNPTGAIARQRDQLITDMQDVCGGYVGGYFRQDPGERTELSCHKNWHGSDDYGVLKTQARILADQVHAQYSGYSEIGQQQVLRLLKNHGGLAFSSTIQDVDKHDDRYLFHRDAYGNNNEKKSLKDYLYQAADSYADALTRYIRDDQDEGDINITDSWMTVRHTRIEFVNTKSEFPPEILVAMGLHAPEAYGDKNHSSLLKMFRTITAELGKANGDYWRSPTLVMAGTSIARHRQHDNGSGVQVDFSAISVTAQNNAILNIIDDELLPFYYQLAALSIETQQELNFLQRPHPLDYASRRLGDFLGIVPEDHLKLATEKWVHWTYTETKSRGNSSATGASDQYEKVYTHYNNTWVELLEDETQRKRLMGIWGERHRNALVNQLKHNVRIVDQNKFNHNVQKLFSGWGGILDNDALGSDLEDLRSSFERHYSQRTREIENAYKEQEAQRILLKADDRARLARVRIGKNYYDVLTNAEKRRVDTARFIFSQRLGAHADAYQLHNLQHLREKQLDIAKAVFSHIPIIGSFVDIGIDAARGDWNSLGHDVLESVAVLVSFIPVVGPVLGAVIGAADLAWAISDQVNAYLKAKRLGNDEAADEAIAGITMSVASGLFMLGGAIHSAGEQPAATPEVFDDAVEGFTFDATEQVNIKGSSELETAYRGAEGDLYSVGHDTASSEVPTVSRLIAVDEIGSGQQVFVKVPLGKLPERLTFTGTAEEAGGYHLEFSDQWNAAEPETGQPTRVFKATRTRLNESGEPLRGVEEESYYMRRSNGTWTRVAFDGEEFSYINDTPDLPSVPTEEPGAPEQSTPVDHNGFPDVPAFDPETLELDARLERLREGQDRVAELRQQLEDSRGLVNRFDSTTLGESRSAALAKLTAMENKVDEFALDLSDVNPDAVPQPGAPEYETYWDNALTKLDEISQTIDEIGDQELEQRLAELRSWKTNLDDSNSMPGLTEAERQSCLADLDTLIEDTEKTRTGLSDKMAAEVEVLERRLRQLQGLDRDATVLGTGDINAAPLPPTEEPAPPTTSAGDRTPGKPDGTLERVRTRELPVLDEIAPELRQLTESLENFAEEIANIDAEQAQTEQIALTHAEIESVYQRVFERAVKAVNEEVPAQTPTAAELDTHLVANASALSKEAVKVSDATTLASGEATSALASGQARFYYPEDGASGVAGDREVSVLVPVKLEEAKQAELYRYEIARGLTDDEYQRAITSEIARTARTRQTAQPYVTGSGRALDLVYVPSIKSVIPIELTRSLTREQRELNRVSVPTRASVADYVRGERIKSLQVLNEQPALSGAGAFTKALERLNSRLDAAASADGDQASVNPSILAGDATRLQATTDTLRSTLGSLATETAATRTGCENRLVTVKRLSDNLARLRDVSQSDLALRDYLRLIDSFSAERDYLESEITLLTKRGQTLSAASQALVSAASNPLSATATLAQVRDWIATLGQARETADMALKGEVRRRLDQLLPANAPLPEGSGAEEESDLARIVRNLVAQEPADPATAKVGDRLVALDQPLHDVVARLENQLSPDVSAPPTAAEFAERLEENGRYVPETGERLAADDPISTSSEATLARTTGIPHFHTDADGTKWILVPVEATTAGTADLVRMEVETGVDYETWTQAWRDTGGALPARTQPVAIQLTTFGETWLVLNLPERGVVLTKPTNVLLTEIKTRAQTFDPNNPSEVQFAVDGKNYRLGMAVDDRGGVSWSAQDHVAGPIVLRQKAAAVGQTLDLFEMIDVRTGEVYRSGEGEPITVVRSSRGAYTTTALHNEGISRSATMPVVAVTAAGEEISVTFYQRNAFGTELWAEADAAGIIRADGRIFAREFGVQFRDIVETGDQRPVSEVVDARVLTDVQTSLSGSEALDGRTSVSREFSVNDPVVSLVVRHGWLIDGVGYTTASGKTEIIGGTQGTPTTISLDNLAQVKIHTGDYQYYNSSHSWGSRHVIGMAFLYNDGSTVNVGDVNSVHSSNVSVEDIEWKGAVLRGITAFNNDSNGYLGGIGFDLASVDYQERFAADAAWSEVETAIRDRANPEHHVSWTSPTGEVYSSAIQAPGAKRVLVKLAHSSDVVALRQADDGTWQQIDPATGTINDRAADVKRAWGGYFFRPVTRKTLTPFGPVTRKTLTFLPGSDWSQVEAAVITDQSDVEWTASDGITYSSSELARDPRHRLVTLTQDDGTQKVFAAENISGWSWSVIDVETGDTVPGNFLVNSHDGAFEFYFDQEVANSANLIQEIAGYKPQELNVPTGGWVGTQSFGSSADWASVTRAHDNAQTVRKFVEWTSPSGTTYSSRVFPDPTNPDLLTVLPDSSELVALSRMSDDSWAVIDRSTGEADLTRVVTRQADGNFSAPVDILAQQRAFQESFLGNFAVEAQEILPANERLVAAAQEARARYLGNRSGVAGAPVPEAFEFEGQTFVIAELTGVDSATGPQLLREIAMAANGGDDRVYELIDSETGKLVTELYREQPAGASEAKTYGKRFVQIVEDQNGRFRSTSALNREAVATGQERISVYGRNGEKIDVVREFQTRDGWYSIDPETGFQRKFHSSVSGGLFQETTGLGLLGGADENPHDVAIRLEPDLTNAVSNDWNDVTQRFNDGTPFLAFETGGRQYVRHFDINSLPVNSAVMQLNAGRLGIDAAADDTVAYAFKHPNPCFTISSDGLISRTGAAVPDGVSGSHDVTVTVTRRGTTTRYTRKVDLPSYPLTNFRIASVDGRITAIRKISGKSWQEMDPATGKLKSSTATDVIVESAVAGDVPTYNRHANHIDSIWQLATGATARPFNGVNSFGYTGNFRELGEHNPGFRFAKSASADDADQNVAGLLHIREDITQLGDVAVTPFSNKLSVAVLELNGVKYVRGYGQRLISLEDLTYMMGILDNAVSVGGQSGILRALLATHYNNDLSPGQSVLMLLSEAASYHIDDSGVAKQVNHLNTPDLAAVRREVAGKSWANYSIGSIKVPGIERGDRDVFLLNNKGGVYVDYNKFENRLILFQGAWRSVAGQAPSGGESSHFLSGPIISELKGVSSVEALYHPSVPGARLPAYANYFSGKTDVAVAIPKENPAILRVTLQDGTQHLISIADKSVKMGFGTSLHNAARSGAPFASQPDFSDIDTYSYDGSFISRQSSFNTGPASKLITTTLQSVDAAPLVLAREGAIAGRGRWLWDGLWNLGRNRLFSPGYLIGRTGNIASKTLLTIGVIAVSSRVAELFATAFSQDAVGHPTEGPFANAANGTNVTDWVDSLITQATDTVLPTLYENITGLLSNDTLNATLADSFNITDNVTGDETAPLTIDDVTTAFSTLFGNITESVAPGSTTTEGPQGLANPELWGLIASMVAAQQTITTGSEFAQGFFNLEGYPSHQLARIGGGALEELARLMVNYGIQYGASGVFTRGTPEQEMLGIASAAIVLSALRSIRNRIPGSAARFDASIAMAGALRAAELATDCIWRGNLLNMVRPAEFSDTGIGIGARAISREDKASLPIAQFLIETLKNDNLEALRAQLATRRSTTLLGSERLAKAGNRFVGALTSLTSGLYDGIGNRILGPIGRTMTEAWPEGWTRKGIVEHFGRWRKSRATPSERETAYAAQIEGSVQRDLDILARVAAGDADDTALEQIYDRLKDGTYRPAGADRNADASQFRLTFNWGRNVGSGMRELFLSAGRAAGETHLAIQSSLNFRKYTAAKFQGELRGSVPFGETTFSTQYQREIARVHTRLKALATLKADLGNNPRAGEITNAIVKYTVESGLFHYKLRYDDTGSRFVEDLGDGDVALHNTVLANGKLLTPRANERVDGLDVLLVNYGFGIAQKFDSITYRGVNTQSSIIPDDPSNALVFYGVTGRSFSSGDVLTNTEILSTSQAGPLASNFANSIDQFQTQAESRLTMVIRGKTSVNVSQITDQNQAETIYSPGALFEIEKIEGDESGNDLGRVVYLRQIDTSEWELNNYYYRRYVDDGATFENTIDKAAKLSGDDRSFMIVEPYTGKTYKITDTGDRNNPQLGRQYAPIGSYFTGRVLDGVDNAQEVARWRRPFDGDSTTSGMRNDIYHHFARNDDQHIISTRIGDLTRNIHMAYFRQDRADALIRAVGATLTTLIQETDSTMFNAWSHADLMRDVIRLKRQIATLSDGVSALSSGDWQQQLDAVDLARNPVQTCYETVFKARMQGQQTPQATKTPLENVEKALSNLLDFADSEKARVEGELKAQKKADDARESLEKALDRQRTSDQLDRQTPDQLAKLLSWQIANHLRREVTIHNLVPSTTQERQFQTGTVAFQVSKGFDGTRLTNSVGIDIGQVRDNSGAVTYYVRNARNGGHWTRVDVAQQGVDDGFAGMDDRARDLLYAVCLELHPDELNDQGQPKTDFLTSLRKLRSGTQRLASWQYDRYRVALSHVHETIQADPSYSGVAFNPGGTFTTTVSLNKSYAASEFADMEAANAAGFSEMDSNTQNARFGMYLGHLLYQKAGEETLYYETNTSGTINGDAPKTSVRLIPVERVEPRAYASDQGEDRVLLFKNLEKGGRALDGESFKGDRFAIATISTNDVGESAVAWRTSRFRPIDLATKIDLTHDSNRATADTDPQLARLFLGSREGLDGRIFTDGSRNLFVKDPANGRNYIPVRAVSVRAPWIIQGEPGKNTLAFQNLENPETLFFWTSADAVSQHFFEAFIPYHQGGNFTVLQSMGHAKLEDALNDPGAGRNAFLFRTDLHGNEGTWTAIAQGQNGREVIRELFGDSAHPDTSRAAQGTGHLACVANGKAYVETSVNNDETEKSIYLASDIQGNDPIGAAPVLSEEDRILIKEGLVGVNGQRLFLYRDLASNMRELFLPTSQGLAKVTEIRGDGTITAAVRKADGGVQTIEVAGAAAGRSVTVRGTSETIATLVGTNQAWLDIVFITSDAGIHDIAGRNRLLSSHALANKGIPMVFHNQDSNYLWTYDAAQGVRKGLVPPSRADVNGRYPLTGYKVTDNVIAHYVRDAEHGTGSWTLSVLHGRENGMPYVSFGSLNLEVTVTQGATAGSLDSVSFTYRGQAVLAIGSDGTLARDSSPNTEVLTTNHDRR